MVSKAKENLKKEVEETISEVLSELEDEEKERVPGAVIRGIKIPWTLKDVHKAFPKEVTFTPEESIPVTYNGVRFWLVADEEITVPSIIKHIYDEHRKSIRNTGKVALYMGATFQSGAGSL